MPCDELLKPEDGSTPPELLCALRSLLREDILDMADDGMLEPPEDPPLDAAEEPPEDAGQSLAAHATVTGIAVHCPLVQSGMSQERLQLPGGPLQLPHFVGPQSLVDVQPVTDDAEDADEPPQQAQPTGVQHATAPGVFLPQSWICCAGSQSKELWELAAELVVDVRDDLPDDDAPHTAPQHVTFPESVVHTPETQEGIVQNLEHPGAPHVPHTAAPQSPWVVQAEDVELPEDCGEEALDCGEETSRWEEEDDCEEGDEEGLDDDAVQAGFDPPEQGSHRSDAEHDPPLQVKRIQRWLQAPGTGG